MTVAAISCTGPTVLLLQNNVDKYHANRLKKMSHEM